MYGTHDGDMVVGFDSLAGGEEAAHERRTFFGKRRRDGLRDGMRRKAVQSQKQRSWKRSLKENSGHVRVPGQAGRESGKTGTMIR